MAPDPEYLRWVFNRLERTIEDRWSVPVRIQDVPNPFTGDLDGEQIMVDYDLEVEDALFILIHLFGHTVQWNVSAARREVAFLAPATWTDEQLRAVMEYEAEACRYSMQLLHDAGVYDLDPWISDFAACDSQYLLHFYKTGEKRPFRSFWREGTAILAPLAIPEFRPTQWVSRRQGTVV
ncbi:MAG TPA: hypothetical protein VFT22_37285 [Kofleriaceae bacterium]|nr:hypothetical protein [Kofleriaceae bacterium]